MGRPFIRLSTITGLALAGLAIAACGSTAASSAGASRPATTASASQASPTVTQVPDHGATSPSAAPSAAPDPGASPVVITSAPPVTPAQGYEPIFGLSGQPMLAAKCVVVPGNNPPVFTASLQGSGVAQGVQSLSVQFFTGGHKDQLYQASFAPVSVPTYGRVTFTTTAAAWPPSAASPDSCTFTAYNQP